MRHCINLVSILNPQSIIYNIDSTLFMQHLINDMMLFTYWFNTILTLLMFNKPWIKHTLTILVAFETFPATIYNHCNLYVQSLYVIFMTFCRLELLILTIGRGSLALSSSQIALIFAFFAAPPSTIKINIRLPTISRECRNKPKRERITKSPHISFNGIGSASFHWS